MTRRQQQQSNVNTNYHQLPLLPLVFYRYIVTRASGCRTLCTSIFKQLVVVLVVVLLCLCLFVQQLQYQQLYQEQRHTTLLQVTNSFLISMKQINNCWALNSSSSSHEQQQQQQQQLEYNENNSTTSTFVISEYDYLYNYLNFLTNYKTNNIDNNNNSFVLPTTITREMLQSLSTVIVLNKNDDNHEITLELPSLSKSSSTTVLKENKIAKNDANNKTMNTSSDNKHCNPMGIHIAQRTNVDPINYTVSMTVSFYLNYKHCSNVIPLIIYGNVDDKGNDITSTNTANINASLKVTGIAIGTNPKQYNYTSSQTMKPNEVYNSRWIYHIELFNISASLGTQHWYKIFIFDQQKQEQQEEQVKEKKNDSLFLDESKTMKRKRNTLLRRTTTSTDISSGAIVDDATVLDTSSTTNSSSTSSHRSNDNDDNNVYYFPSPPRNNEITTIAFVGDLGQTTDSLDTATNIVKQSNATHLLIAGDMSYADSDPYRWERWFTLMEFLLSSIPTSVVPGNHEIECNTLSNTIFIPYENQFYNPNRIQDAEIVPISEQYKQSLYHHACSCPSTFEGIYNYGNSFYSYQHGLAYIIVLNSYTGTNTTSAQYIWLVSELQYYTTVFRNTGILPWLIISYHAPFYTTFIGHNNEINVLTMQKFMEPLFNLYNVNIVMNGHDHAYMRTKPIRYNPLQPHQPFIDTSGNNNGTIYITIGTGGNREGHNKNYINPNNIEYWVETRTIQDFGYGILQIYNHSYAHWKWNKDYNINTSYHDDNVWIYNPHSV